jgi:hypothetical protein
MESKVDINQIDFLSKRLIEKIVKQVNSYSEEIQNSLNISDEKFEEDLNKIINFKSSK